MTLKKIYIVFGVLIFCLLILVVSLYIRLTQQKENLSEKKDLIVNQVIPDSGKAKNPNLQTEIAPNINTIPPETNVIDQTVIIKSLISDNVSKDINGVNTKLRYGFFYKNTKKWLSIQTFSDGGRYLFISDENFEGIERIPILMDYFIDAENLTILSDSKVTFFAKKGNGLLKPQKFILDMSLYLDKKVNYLSLDDDANVSQRRPTAAEVESAP